MTWPYVCEHCGASLDAGEHCTCGGYQNDEGRQRDNEEETNTCQNRHLPCMR